LDIPPSPWIVDPSQFQMTLHLINSQRKQRDDHHIIEAWSSSSSPPPNQNINLLDEEQDQLKNENKLNEDQTQQDPSSSSSSQSLRGVMQGNISTALRQSKNDVLVDACEEGDKMGDEGCSEKIFKNEMGDELQRDQVSHQQLKFCDLLTHFY